MKAFYSDTFVLPLPEGHRFPMIKYARLRGRLVSESVLQPQDLEVAAAIADRDVLRVHERGYFERVVAGSLERREVRELGFPWSPQLVERSRRSVGGTLAACRDALRSGVAVNLAGGTHHAFAHRGEGFCVLNDVAIAGRALQAEGSIERLLVVDCDVHQGNGTAVIFHGDPTVFTLSLHGAKNFPFRKQESDLDVPLGDDTGDDEYLDRLEAALEAARRSFAADLVVYLAGADPYVQDRLGRLALSKQGLAERDATVFSRCRAPGLPVAVVMAGGYAREVDDTVDIHYETVRQAAALCTAAGGGRR